MTCFLCRFECEQDDIANKGVRGAVICLRCWSLRTEGVSVKPMPKELRREVAAFVNSLPEAA